jgi:hypothetical protein
MTVLSLPNGPTEQCQRFTRKVGIAAKPQLLLKPTYDSIFGGSQVSVKLNIAVAFTKAA